MTTPIPISTLDELMHRVAEASAILSGVNANPTLQERAGAIQCLMIAALMVSALHDRHVVQNSTIADAGRLVQEHPHDDGIRTSVRKRLILN